MAQGAAARKPPPPDGGRSSTRSQAAPPPVPAAARRTAALFQQAASLAKAGKADQAISVYRKVIAAARAAGQPSGVSLAAYHDMEILYQQKRDLPDLEAVLQEELKLYPSDAGACSDLALMLASRKEYTRASIWAEKALKSHPAPQAAAPAHFVLGTAAMARADLSSARAQFDRAVELAPRNPSALYNDAVVLDRLKQYGPALERCQAAAKLDPGLIDNVRLLAFLLQRAGRLTEAEQRYGQVLAKNPEDGAALNGEAFVLQKLGRPDKAVHVFSRYVALHPTSVSAQLHLAALYEVVHNPEAARPHEQAAVDQLDARGSKDVRALSMLAATEAELAYGSPSPASRLRYAALVQAHLREAMAWQPSDEKLAFQLADFLRHTGKYADAQELYNREIALHPDESAAYFGRADVDVMQQHVPDAISTWEQYQKMKPADPISYEELARIWELQKNWQAAAGEDAALLRLNPVDGNAMLDAAGNYVRLNQYPKADGLYRQVLGLDPRAQDIPADRRLAAEADRQSWRFSAWSGLAQTAEKQDDDELAIQNLKHEQAEELRAALKQRIQPPAPVYLALAALYEKQNQRAQAIQELESYTRLASDDPEGFRQLAKLYEQAGRVEDAAAEWRKAGQRAPSPLNDELAAADLLRRNGKLSEAIRELESLQPRYASDPSALAPLAQALEANGQDGRALKVYRSLVKQQPGLLWVQDREAAVLTRLKQYSEALAIRQRLLAATPADPQVYADIQHLYSLQGELPQYSDWLRQRIQSAPTDETAMEALVSAEQGAGHAQDAWSFLASLAAKSSDKGVWNAYADVLRNHNRTADLQSAMGRIASMAGASTSVGAGQAKK